MKQFQLLLFSSILPHVGLSLRRTWFLSLPMIWDGLTLTFTGRPLSTRSPTFNVLLHWAKVTAFSSSLHFKIYNITKSYVYK